MEQVERYLGNSDTKSIPDESALLNSVFGKTVSSISASLIDQLEAEPD